MNAAPSATTDPSAHPSTAQAPASNASVPVNAPPATVPSTPANASASQSSPADFVTVAPKAIRAGQTVSHAPVTALVARTTPALPHAAVNSAILAPIATSALTAITVSPTVPSADVVKVALA